MGIPLSEFAKVNLMRFVYSCLASILISMIIQLLFVSHFSLTLFSISFSVLFLSCWIVLTIVNDKKNKKIIEEYKNIRDKLKSELKPTFDAWLIHLQDCDLERILNIKIKEMLDNKIDFRTMAHFQLYVNFCTESPRYSNYIEIKDKDEIKKRFYKEYPFMENKI